MTAPGQPSPPARFLAALAKLISTMGLYREGHPARARTLDAAFDALGRLLEEAPRPVFSFLDGEVVYGERPLRDLRDWEWSVRFAEIGVERLELQAGISRAEFESFVDEVFARISFPELDASEREMIGHPSIRFGPIHVRGIEEREAQAIPTATMGLSLHEEAEAIGWLHGEIQGRGEVPVGEAEAVVRLLSVAMHGERQMVVPLVQLKEVDQYTTTHSINVSVLVMALAEFLGLVSTDVRALGEAALLHDVGKTRIPLKILNKPGKLDRDEWEVVQMHTVEGARILLQSGSRLELAAMVAYEHHLTYQGGGYPALAWPRKPHRLSRLVQVCDIYDALRTRRPFRPPWSVARVLSYLEERSGRELDAEFVSAFLTMIRQWEPRAAALHPDEPEAVAAGA